MAERSMTTDRNLVEMEWLEARITLALETAPQLKIPADFAARVAARVPPLPTVAVTPPRYGRIAAVLCMAVLLALMLAFAGRAGGSSLVWTTTAEWIFCGQFLVMAVWLAGRELRG